MQLDENGILLLLDLRVSTDPEGCNPPLHREVKL